jgi:hypothetical protein
MVFPSAEKSINLGARVVLQFDRSSGMKLSGEVEDDHN